MADYHNFDVRNLVIDEISAEEIDSNLRYVLYERILLQTTKLR